MLVLKRKVEESVTIADQIKVKVLAIIGESVNLGIEAPREIKIFRTDNIANKENGSGNQKGKKRRIVSGKEEK